MPVKRAISFIYRLDITSGMTTADKFGIAFSIGFTIALVAVALSFSGMSTAPANTMPTPPPAPTPTPTPAPVEEPAPIEEPVETPVEEPEVEISEPVMSAEVSIPSGSSVPGCEETNECFIPAEVTISVGGTVTWTNDDTAAHTVTSGTATDGPDGIFDSSIFMAGKTFEHTFDEAGEYDYFCIVHPWMTGKVVVE